MNNNKPVLWYFADPMCSWCWGFSPVIAKVKNNYADQINIAMVMGGLRVDETERLSSSSRNDILHHWHQVNKLTGQTFVFENAIPEGFVYNTEPACRAVIVAAKIDATKMFGYFTAIQTAFYLQNLDVTQTSTLLQLAADCGLNADAFNRLFQDEIQQQTTQKNFQFARKAGVQGFPTLILSMHENLHIICRGYQDYEQISFSLDTLLSS